MEWFEVLCKYDRIVLSILKEIPYFDLGERGYVSFSWLMKNTELDRKDVRFCCRKLRHYGLTEYSKGLMNENGEVKGAGYRITKKGDKLMERIDDSKSGK